MRAKLASEIAQMVRLTARYIASRTPQVLAGVSRTKWKQTSLSGGFLRRLIIAPALLATFVLAAPAQAQVEERGVDQSKARSRSTGPPSGCRRPRPPSRSVGGGGTQAKAGAAAVDLAGGHHALHAGADLDARQGVLHPRRRRLRLLGHRAAERQQERGLDRGPLRQRGPGRLRHQLGVRPRLQGRLGAARRLRGRRTCSPAGAGPTPATSATTSAPPSSRRRAGRR